MANEYLAEVYYGLAKGEAIRDIHRAIRQVTLLNAKRGIPRNAEEERYAMALAKKGAKRLYGAPFSQKLEAGGVLATAGLAFAWLEREEAYEGMRKIAYAQARAVETKSKDKILIDASKRAQAEAEALPEEEWKKAKAFYIASEHDDCAEDHEAYQGRLYYDRFWRRFAKTEEARRTIQNIIASKGLKSMQWVINRPAWLITRPNCRHYFEQVTIAEAEACTEAEIVSNHDMHTAVGQRGVSDQTIQHSTKAGWYTEKNVRNIIEQYKDRLAYHRALWEKTKDPKMRDYMQKDQRLIKKWEYFLATRF